MPSGENWRWKRASNSEQSFGTFFVLSFAAAKNLGIGTRLQNHQRFFSTSFGWISKMIRYLKNFNYLPLTDGDIDLEDLNLEKSYTPLKAYQQSKLANVLFSSELARKLKGNILFKVSKIFNKLKNLCRRQHWRNQYILPTSWYNIIKFEPPHEHYGFLGIQVLYGLHFGVLNKKCWARCTNQYLLRRRWECWQRNWIIL